MPFYVFNIQRYEFHGSSLRLVEEILHDTELLNDVPRMHQLFSSAFAMAPGKS